MFLIINNNSSFSQFDNPKFINDQSDLWIDTSDLIPNLNNDDEDYVLNGVVVEVIPMLILLKEMAKFEQKFFTNDSGEASANQWEKFNFIIGNFYYIFFYLFTEEGIDVIDVKKMVFCKQK